MSGHEGGRIIEGKEISDGTLRLVRLQVITAARNDRTWSTYKSAPLQTARRGVYGSGARFLYLMSYPIELGINVRLFLVAHVFRGYI